MIAEIIVSILIGILLGAISGLTPGVHINLISTLILTFSPALLNFFTPLTLAIIILSMAVTHTFLDFIPSVYLGAPDPDTATIILPAHRMLLDGKGYEAVSLSMIGSLLGLIMTIAAAPLIIVLLKNIYPILEKNIAYILIMISILLILKNKNKTAALLLFLLSGLLGVISLNLNVEQILFPLLSGLFGTSMLLLSLKDNAKIPRQRITNPRIKKTQIGKAMLSSLSISTLAGFLPGIGASQTAIISSALIGKKSSPKLFLILVGSINTIIMVVSFIALYLINKSRNGAVVVISELMSALTLKNLLLFLSCSLIVGGIAALLGLRLAKTFSAFFTRINYKLLCVSIIIFITILVLLLTGIVGFITLLTATAVGVLPPLLKTERNYLMGCLIVPTTLFFIL